MDEAGVDAVVLRLAENIVLATRLVAPDRRAGFVVIVPREGAATLLVPEYEADEARERLAGDIRSFPAIRNDGPSPGAGIIACCATLAGEHGATGGAIGFEGSFESLAAAARCRRAERRRRCRRRR